MAQCKLTPHEFIQNAFSPMVAVMCSPLVDQMCQKNNLSFTEMIQPFCKLNTEAHFRDPSGNVITMRNLRITMQDINFRPPQPTLARKCLNESVSLSTSDRNSSLQIANETVEVPASVPWFEAWRETFLQVQFPSDHEFTKHYLSCILVVSSAESSPADTLLLMSQQLQQLQTVAPAKLPKWFCLGVLRYYVLLHDALDGSSDKAEAAFDAIKNTYGVNNCYFLQMNSRPPGQMEDQSHLPDPWSQFLVRQFDTQDTSDHDSSPRTPAEMGGVTGMPSRITLDGSIESESGPVEPTSLELAQEAGESGPTAGAIAVTRHPLSPETDEETHSPFMASTVKTHNSGSDPVSAPNHINMNVWAGHASQMGQAAHGACLTSSDLDRIRGLVQDFCIKTMLPYVERQIQHLSDLVSNKKGVSRSLLSATKRWFGSNKPGLPSLGTPSNAVIYSSEAPELQLRRLGDLCFMFGHYALAFQAYHSAKRDFNADQAWLYYAGALEMAALSAFMQGESTRKAQEYMEESIVTYLNSCKMPQFATRATLLSTECLKGRGLYGEAAQQFIRMTSEDSDLRSALLLEQASYCFLKAARPRMARKYAFHIVLAGHRFAKAGQRQHSMRCYRQAYQVYESKSWSLAEDHIHLTTGHQAANLKQMAESAKAFAQLLTPASRQTAAQQAVYLREFLSIQQQLSANEGSDPSSPLPVLPLPLVEQDSVRVLVGPLPPLPPPPLGVGPVLVPATGVTFEDDHPDSTRWSKLEEALVTEAQGSLPMIFKPTVQMFSNRTNNTSNPIGVVGEPVSVRVRLCNPLHTALPLQELQLLWSLEPQPGQYVESKSGQAQAQCVDALLMPPDCTQDVVLSIVPLSVGELHITGLSYQLASPLSEPGPLASPQVEPGTLAVAGKQTFTLKSIRQARGSKESTVDKRLQVVITPPAPCLQVNFQGLSSEMLCGELQQVTMEFRNVGNAPLTGLRVATSTPVLFVLRGPSVQLGGYRVSCIPLNKQLEPGQVHSVPLWLRAPDIPGNATLDMLMYYENIASTCIPRYRLVRHSWLLSVAAGVQLVAIAQHSKSSNSSGAQRVLNIALQVKNCNQVHDPVMTEVSLVQISLASPLWKLSDSVVMPKEVKLQSQEMVHLVLKGHRRAEQNNERILFSDISLDDRNKHLESMSASPYLDFFNNYLSSKKSNSETSDSFLESQGERNESLSTGLVDISIVLRWQACVTAGLGKKRTALGQHHMRIESVGKTTAWPPNLTPAATAVHNTQPDGPLRIFGPEAASSHSLSSAASYPSLDVLQKLVTYSIQHPPQVAHNFGHTRLCVVPVQMRLQNCSGQQLLVKIKTLGNSSNSSSVNKNQLYSPHSACTFGWVGLAEAWLELDPHGTAAVGLAAALGAPGTFDLGARLEVWCREFSAPAADAITQSWRVESALIVSSA